MVYTFSDWNRRNYLMHHGVPGMQWGKRKRDDEYASAYQRLAKVETQSSGTKRTTEQRVSTQQKQQAKVSNSSLDRKGPSLTTSSSSSKPSSGASRVQNRGPSNQNRAGGQNLYSGSQSNLKGSSGGGGGGSPLVSEWEQDEETKKKVRTGEQTVTAILSKLERGNSGRTPTKTARGSRGGKWLNLMQSDRRYGARF